MAHEFIILERGFLVTWPIDFLSGSCPVSAQHAQLDRCCVSQSMCKMFPLFRKRPTTIYSACEKKFEEKVQLLVPSLLLRKGGFLEERGW